MLQWRLDAYGHWRQVNWLFLSLMPLKRIDLTLPWMPRTWGHGETAVDWASEVYCVIRCPRFLRCKMEGRWKRPKMRLELQCEIPVSNILQPKTRNITAQIGFCNVKSSKAWLAHGQKDVGNVLFKLGDVGATLTEEICRWTCWIGAHDWKQLQTVNAWLRLTWCKVSSGNFNQFGF